VALVYALRIVCQLEPHRHLMLGPDHGFGDHFGRDVHPGDVQQLDLDHRTRRQRDPLAVGHRAGQDSLAGPGAARCEQEHASDADRQANGLATSSRHLCSPACGSVETWKRYGRRSQAPCRSMHAPGPEGAVYPRSAAPPAWPFTPLPAPRAPGRRRAPGTAADRASFRRRRAQRSAGRIAWPAPPPRRRAPCRPAW
jgi:hypothetical protein